MKDMYTILEEYDQQQRILQSAIGATTDKLLAAREEVFRLERRLAEQDTELEKLKKNIEHARIQKEKASYSAKDPITDHALCRYMERAQGFDIETLKKSVVKGHENAIKAVGTHGKVKAGNLTFIVENGIVVTVI